MHASKANYYHSMTTYSVSNKMNKELATHAKLPKHIKLAWIFIKTDKKSVTKTCFTPSVDEFQCSRKSC